MTPHAKYDTGMLKGRQIRAALAVFNGNIYQNHLFYLNFPTLPLQNYINLRGLSNKNRQINIRISKRIPSRIQKGLSP
jgi:hypothetical protein